VSLDDAIRTAEEAAQKLREALEVLSQEAAAAGCGLAEAALLQGEASRLSVGGVRRAVAEARRPRGSTVTLEFVGGYGEKRAPLVGEVIRRTAAQVVVRHGSSDDYYRLDSGKPACSGTSYFYGYWRIREADLPALREMPIGENAVSRALKAIEAGKYDEVKL
jgi:hypothetical protein